MHDVNPDPSDDLVRRVLNAFPPGKYGWRTVRGVSQDLGLTEDAVAAAIAAHRDLFRRSSISPAGIPLYRPRQVRPALTAG